MNPIERDIMKGLVSILNEASDRYYNSGSPIMTDAQFDARLADLKHLEEEIGFVFANSPTQNVGYKVLGNIPEIEHNHLMLSLDKRYSVEDVIKFANNREVIASIKADGLTVSIKYDNGILVSAESRGNGYVGSDITEHIKHFKNVPLKINKSGIYVIDGEAVILDKDFEEINVQRVAKNEEMFESSRNLACGTLTNVLDTYIVSERKMRFFGWDVIEGGGNSLKENLTEARSLGFDIIPFWSVTYLDHKKLQSTIDYVFEYAKDDGIPCDGIVFKYDDIEYGKSLGHTSKFFRNAIAYKAEDEARRTKLIDIEFTVGKSGLITPTAVFEPVKLDGATIQKASVHNISILTKLDLHKGDTIEVCRKNSVIPQVKRNVSADERIALGKEPDCIVIPSVCPICNCATEVKQDNDSRVLICTNDNCKGKLLGKLTHFVSKNAMNIENISESTLEKFIELGWLNSFEDIYNLKDYSSWMMQLEGFGEKSVKKLLNSIEKSKNTTLDRFIYALSVPLIGRSASKTISKYFNGDFERFYNECVVQKFDYRALDDFGDTMTESINEYLDKNRFMIGILSRYMNFEKLQVVSCSNSLEGKVFCITGSLNHFANRDEAKEKIESLGGKVSGSVSTKTNYLVNNDVASTSGKNKKAKELNIPIISEEELIKMLN